jgi:hypothetical protein
MPDPVESLREASQQGCTRYSCQAFGTTNERPVTAPIERDVIQMRNITRE